jgi:hypothetical protein
LVGSLFDDAEEDATGQYSGISAAALAAFSALINPSSQTVMVNRVKLSKSDSVVFNCIVEGALHDDEHARRVGVRERVIRPV